MPNLEHYVSINPYDVPEPRFIIGYTGYLPGYGPKRLYQMAKPYGRMTNELIEKHPIAGERLADILDTSYDERLEGTKKYFVSLHERNANNLKLRHAMITGYTGYIPQRKYVYDKAYPLDCENAIAHFERFQELTRKDRQQGELKDVDVPRFQLPESLPEYPIDQSYFDPRIEYNIKHLLVEKPQRYKGAVDPTDTEKFRSFSELSLEASNMRIHGKTFSVNEFLHGRIARSRTTKPTSVYDCDDDESQTLRYDKPIPWYMWSKPGIRPEFGKPRNELAAPTDVLAPHKLFAKGLRPLPENVASLSTKSLADNINEVHNNETHKSRQT